MGMATNVVRLRGGKVVPAWTFADRVRKARRSLPGMSQAKMAAALGVGEKAYAAWESGVNKPDDLPMIAERLEEVVGWDRAWFLGWLDGPTDDDPTHAGGVDLRTPERAVQNRKLLKAA